MNEECRQINIIRPLFSTTKRNQFYEFLVLPKRWRHRRHNVNEQMNFEIPLQITFFSLFSFLLCIFFFLLLLFFLFRLALVFVITVDRNDATLHLRSVLYRRQGAMCRIFILTVFPHKPFSFVNVILSNFSFSFFQLGFFAYYSLMSGQLEPAGPIPIDSLFIYRPDKRQELWRFGTYMVLHAG